MRRHLSTRDRVRIFDAASGMCGICGQKIQVGERWDADHEIALGIGGKDELGNLRPAHRSCHADKTRNDTRAAAKTKRVRAKHIGAQRRSGFRGWRRFNGDVVWANKEHTR